MREIGYLIAGGQFGIAFAAFAINHGAKYGRVDYSVSISLGFIIWTILMLGESTTEHRRGE